MNQHDRKGGFIASARAIITMSPETLENFMDGKEQEWREMRFVAEDAGYVSAKRTQEAIPMSFPLPLEAFQFEFSKQSNHQIEVRCNIQTKRERTSASMEALSAASMAAFMLKDVCHHIDAGMHVSNVEIIKK